MNSTTSMIRLGRTLLGCAALALAACSPLAPMSQQRFEGAIADSIHDGRAKVTEREIFYAISEPLTDGRQMMGFAISRKHDKFLDGSGHVWSRSNLVIAGDFRAGQKRKLGPGNEKIRAWLVRDIPLSYFNITQERKWKHQLEEAWRSLAEGRLDQTHPEASQVPLYGEIYFAETEADDYQLVVNLSSDRRPNPDADTLLSGQLTCRDPTEGEQALAAATIGGNALYVMALVAQILASTGGAGF